jgi:hypothetical protein
MKKDNIYRIFQYLPFLLLYFSLFSLNQNLYCEPAQLKSFTEILDALNKGEKVNAVIHYGDCKLTVDGKESKSQDAIGGIAMLPFDYYAAGVITKRAFISSSQTVMIYLAGFNGFVYNYVKLRVYDDNAVEITVKYLTVDKLEVKMDELFTGEINDGSNGKGVYFYIQK